MFAVRFFVVLAHVVVAVTTAPNDSKYDEAVLEHFVNVVEPALAPQGLDGHTILELGNFRGFFHEKNCQVLTTDDRYENSRKGVGVLKSLDLDHPPPRFFISDFIVAYNALHHLQNPSGALEWMARHSSSGVVLSTCVKFEPIKVVSRLHYPKHGS